jgi:hypothetical protein
LQKRSTSENSTTRSILLRSPNVFATTKTKWIKVARLEKPEPDADLLSDPADPMGTS